MKVALFSDIHSNLEALQACYAHAQSRGAEAFTCLGDSVGYGPDPGPVLDLLISMPGLISILGNHDEGVCGLVSFGTAEYAQSVFNWTRDKLSIAHMDYLMSLPEIELEYDATFVHASAYRPRDWIYVDNLREAKISLKSVETPVTFIGHTHLPAIYWLDEEGEAHMRRPVDGEHLFVGDGGKYLVNVGSVGQPRDLNNSASYATFDPSRMQVQFHRVPYNFRRTMDKILQAQLPQFLAERLEHGR